MEENYPTFQLHLPECMELIYVPLDKCIYIVEEETEDD